MGIRVLLTIPTLSQISGGPAAVVQGLSEHLALLGASVSVLTYMTDPGQSEVLLRDDLVKVIHTSRSGFAGGFSNCLNKLLATRTIDVVHDFGLWMPANHAVTSVCYKSRIPLVSSPSGMLAGWALRHKAWKKRIAWWLYQRRDLVRATMLAATSSQELLDIRAKFPSKSIALIPNGVEISVLEANALTEVNNRVRKVVFLGRIHPVKGLKNLIEAWKIVRPNGWRCILAGPDEAGHQAELRSLLQYCALEDKFEFAGLVEGESKWDLLRSADIFALPSFTENFGISVAEALASVTPVITTKGTPWGELLEQRCGWWVDLGVEPLANALREAISLSDKQRHEMGLRGRKLVEQNYSWDIVGRKMLDAYSWVLGRGPKPACIDPR